MKTRWQLDGREIAIGRTYTVRPVGGREGWFHKLTEVRFVDGVSPTIVSLPTGELNKRAKLLVQ